MKTNNQIEYTLITDLGKKRDNNEDNYIYAFANDILLIGVIDGVGGYEGGEVAAELCKKSVESSFLDLPDFRPENTEERLRIIAITANNLIASERNKNNNLSRMSCVASFAVLDKKKEILHYAHVGDTRGYVFRNGELLKFTHDHSIVGYLEENGTISEEDALRHPRRNEISRMYGEKIISDDNKEFVETGSHSFYTQDIVLFCSDGLTDLVRKSEIEFILSNSTITLDEKAQSLVNRANELGGKDNITVTLASYFTESKNDISEAPLVNIEIENSKTSEMTSNTKRTKFSFLKWIIAFLIGLLIGFSVNTKGSKSILDNILHPSDSTNNKSVIIYLKPDTMFEKPDTVYYKLDTVFIHVDSLNI